MLNKLSFGAILLVGFLLVGYILIQFWPVTVIKPNVQPYKIFTKKVKVGGQLVYVVNACKYTEASGVITRTFVDGVRYPSITSTGNVKPGCTITPVSIQVPNYINPGSYHLELSVQYKINPLRSDTYQFKTETFEVVK